MFGVRFIDLGDQIRSDENVSSTGVLLVAVGDSCESAISAAMYHARALIMSASSTPVAPLHELSLHSDDPKAEWMQNWYDGLGYCECLIFLLDVQ